ncbi:MAG: flagellar hook-length control protein FliK [Planctomycetaceae bacterium]|jgi:hypothetical protein|nr:flagellar hook-length control protein FliK [Planctomycetaceae bacterium]
MENGQMTAAGAGTTGTGTYAARSSPHAALSSLLNVLSSKNTLLQDDTPAGKMDECRNAERHNDRRQLGNQQSDALVLDRKTLNESELRSDTMKTEYEKRLDTRRETKEAAREAVNAEPMPGGSTAGSRLHVGVPHLMPESVSARMNHPLPTDQSLSKTLRSASLPASIQTQGQMTNSGTAASQPVISLAVSADSSLTVSAASRSASPVSNLTVFTAANHLTAHLTAQKTEDKNGGASDNTDADDAEEESNEKKEKRKKKNTPSVAAPFADIRALLPPLTEHCPKNRIAGRLAKTLQAYTGELYSGNAHTKRTNEINVIKIVDKREENVKPDTVKSDTEELEYPPIQETAGVTPAQNAVPISPAAVDVVLPDTPDNNQFLRRITAACEAAVLQNAPIRIKVNLDQLGTLSIQLSRQGSQLSLHFETPSKAAARFVSENLAGLRKILADRNVAVMEVSVKVAPLQG